MYPVSEVFKAAINSEEVNIKVRATLRAGGKSYELGHRDIMQNGLKVAYCVLSGDSIAPGEVAGADLTIILTNRDGRFNDVKLNYAEVQPFIDVETEPGIYESVPLGVFEVDTVDRLAVTFDRNFETIPLQAADRTVRLDLPFSRVNIAFPCTAMQLLTAVCQRCGVPLGMSSFMNSGYMIQEAPPGEPSCRDIVSCIAALAGCWAQCDRHGSLVFRWFKSPQFVQEANLDGNVDSADGGSFNDLSGNTYDGGVFKENTPDAVIDASELYEFGIDDAPITVTGVTLQTESETYLVGSPKYAVLMDNPLIQTNIPEVLTSIFDKMRGLTYIPFHGVCLDNPAMEAGDMILLDNIEGKSYRTILTDYEYSFDGRCKIEAVGTSEREHNYVAPARRQFSRLIRTIGQKQEQINAMDEAARALFSLFSGVTGGYRIDGDTLGGEHKGRMYIALDSPDIETAQKVWAYGAAGIFYFEHGIHNEPSTAWGSNGEFLARLITAEMIRAGKLQSNNGASWIDMDNGQFSLGNGALEFVNGSFPVVRAARITNDAGNHYFYVGTGTYGYYGAAFVYDGLEYLEIWPDVARGAHLNFVNAGYITFGGSGNISFGGNGNINFANEGYIGINGENVLTATSSETGIFYNMGGAYKNGIAFRGDGIRVYKDNYSMVGFNGTLPTAAARPTFVNGMCTGYTT